MILKMLDLETWTGKYVALRYFKVIDSDVSVTKLSYRLWNQLPSDEIVIIPVGQPEEIITLEFS